MKEIARLVSNPDYQTLVARNAASEELRIYCRHSFQHMLDVGRITYILMLEAGSFSDWVTRNHIASLERGKEVVYAASLLHDIGRWEQYQTGESHATISARYARQLLEEIDFSEDEIEIVQAAIQEHRSQSCPKTVLGAFLQRADKLSRACWCCDAILTCKERDHMETQLGPLC